MNCKRPYMNYRQHRAACRLVHECCNYDNGNCIVLDNGEPCVCVQSISYSLLCRWFISAVLPLDWKLEAALLHRAELKRCTDYKTVCTGSGACGEVGASLCVKYALGHGWKRGGSRGGRGQRTGGRKRGRAESGRRTILASDGECRA